MFLFRLVKNYIIYIMKHKNRYLFTLYYKTFHSLKISDSKRAQSSKLLSF